MGKQRSKALILGEGPTEFYYFKSLSDIYKNITIKPDYPKHSSIKELADKIEEGISMGYSHIYCVIDMDTKEDGKELSQYEKLKAKYALPIEKPRKGINCRVEFFETHRCTEQFFLYYFRYTSKFYGDQDALIAELNRCVPYEKSGDFFKKCKGLHNYFERNGGSLAKAIENAGRSTVSRYEEGREYTYSELDRLMEKLKELN